MGAGGDAMCAAVDAGLQRLGVDNVDLYYVHVDDLTTPLEEALEVLAIGSRTREQYDIAMGALPIRLRTDVLAALDGALIFRIVGLGGEFRRGRLRNY